MRPCLLSASALGALLVATPACVEAQQAPAKEKPAQTQKAPAATEEERVLEYWKDYRIALDLHPIGPVVPGRRFRLTGYIPIRPIGFRTDAYGFSFTPTYGLGHGWEVTAGVASAERLGRGGTALFYGGGLQKQFVQETSRQPAISIGGFGFVGPHDQHGGSVYLSGSKRVWGHFREPLNVFLHAGVKFDAFSGHDFGHGTGIRPYVGFSSSFHKRFFVSGEYSPSQPWEFDDVFSVRGTYLFRVKRRNIGITGGIRNVGFRTLPFVGVAF